MYFKKNASSMIFRKRNYIWSCLPTFDPPNGLGRTCNGYLSFNGLGGLSKGGL